MIRPRRLTDDQVREVRALYKPFVRGCGYGAIAEKYGVAVSTIRDLIQYRYSYTLRVSSNPETS